jgi:hypothetical protein
MNALALAAVTVAFLLSAGLVAATLQLRSTVSFALAVYVLMVGALVVFGLGLSPLDQVSVAGYSAAAGLSVIGAVLLWRRVGAPSPPFPHLDRSAVRRHPIVAILAAIVALTACYETFVAVTAAPDNGDSLTYRMPRAAAWHQDGAVGWIDGAHTERQNEFPLNTEIQVLYTLTFLDSDGAAALPQLAAKLALIVACAGCARRLGYGRAASLFAGLVLGSLTEVALQAVSTQNDLGVASLALAAAYFVRAPTTASLALAGAAIGLAIGTKQTAFLALPAIALLAAVSLPRHRLLLLGAMTATGVALLGSFAYARNVVHTDRIFGYAHEQQQYRPDVTAPGTISTLARMTYRFVDFSGFRVKTRWLEPISDAGEATFDALGIAPNPPESKGFPFTFTVNVVAHEDHSFFGPLGFLLVLPLSVGFTVAWLLRRTDAQHLAHALALPSFALGLALIFRFSDEARYLIAPVALTMPLAAVVYSRRALAACVAALAGASLVFAHAYNELKPSGLQGRHAVWSLSRAEQMTLDNPEREPLVAAVDRVVPKDGRLGFVLAPSDWDYPLYGPTLERKLVPLPHQRPLVAAERRGLRWVVFGHDRRPAREGWRALRFPKAGTLLIRTEAER